MPAMRRLLSLVTAVVLLFSVMPGAGSAAVLRLPDDVTTIAESAFENDTSLDEVALQEGVEYIGHRAFAGTGLSRVRLPRSLKKIENDAFDGASVGVFEADRGTYAWQWLEDRGYLLHFSDEKMYDTPVEMGIFRGDPEKGLGDDWFAAWYELAEYEELKETAASEPEWSVRQTSGPAAEYALQHFDGQASLSVAMPEEPAVYTFVLSCSWEGRSVSTGATVRYVRLDSLPDGTDIPDLVELNLDMDNVLPFHFVPEDFSFSNMDRVGLADCTGDADAWGEGHVLHIIPHEKGTFTGTVELYAGNLYIGREVTFRVRAVPEQILNQTENLVDEETGKFNMAALVPVSTQGVTDPDDLAQIEAFNAVLPEVQADAEAYNAAMDELYAQTVALNDALGIVTAEETESLFSMTTDLVSFSFEKEAVNLLEGEYEIVSAEFTDDAALLTVLKDGRTACLRVTEAGISLADGSAGRGRQLRAGAVNGGRGESAEGLRNALDQAWNELKPLGDAISRSIPTVVEIAGESSEKLRNFVNEGTLAKIPGPQLKAAKEALDCCKSISDDFIHIQELLQRYDRILKIRNHGHPTDMEANDAIMMNQVNLLRKALNTAIGAYIADMAATQAHIAFMLVTLAKGHYDPETKKLTGGLREFGKKWEPSTDSVLVTTGEWGLEFVLALLHSFFESSYQEVCDIDPLLHCSVAGTVWDQDMKPLQGVRVTLGSNFIYTDAMGSYEIEAPCYGTEVAGSVAAPLFYLEGYRDTGAPHKVDLIPYDKAWLSVQMTEVKDGGRVEGHVYDEKTRQPISGAVVSYQGKYARSGADGYYFIDAPAAKQDTMKVTARGYAPWRNPVTALGTGAVAKADVYMRPISEWTISGTVYGETYDYEQMKWVKNPLPGATVTWDDVTVTTGADGSYEIGRDGVDRYELGPIVYSMEPAYESQKRGVPELTSGTMKEGVDCTLRIRHGSLYVAVGAEHAKDTGAFVRFNSSASVTIDGLAENFTGFAGTAFPVPVGTWSVTVEGVDSGLGKMTDTVTVEEGKTARLEAVLPWLYGLKGRIVDEDGSPLANMTIVADSYKGAAQEDAVVRTDEEGRFWLFNGDPERGGSFKLKGSFVTMDYMEKNETTFTTEKGVLREEAFQVRGTEGKYVRTVLLNVDIDKDETVIRGLAADLSWEDRSLHLESEGSLCRQAYLPAENSAVTVTVSASIGINGALYRRSLTSILSALDNCLGRHVSDKDNKDWN